MTKRLHNRLHGYPGDGGPLGDAERATYEQVLAANLAECSPGSPARHRAAARPADGGPGGRAPSDRREGGVALPRGCDSRNDATDEAWGFLRPYVERADAFVFSRGVPARLDGRGPSRRHPAVDRPVLGQEPRSGSEHRRWHPGHWRAWSGAPRRGSFSFQRRDGSTGGSGHHTDLVAGGSPRLRDARLVVQVSRWDRLKDMAGVLHRLRRWSPTVPTDVHLVLAGPDVSGVTDDPEGAAVLPSAGSAGAACPSRCAVASTSPPYRWTTSTRTP